MTGQAVRNADAQERDAKDHGLVAEDARLAVSKGVRYEKRPVKGTDGKPVAGLYNAWITLDNPTQFNSYTTDMVKAVILAFRAASAARDVVAVVFTGAGDKAFCTGGNTKEYAEYYAGNPQEYRGYMRLFNDMVSAILACDKPVICRINGMRVGGGQEIGMACDFSVAQDLARFGQAGPKHGSAPIGGATDFLPVVIGAERAMAACVLCEPFSAHEAYFMGILTDIVPALKVDGKFIANPLVETSRITDEFGRFTFGKPKSGEALKAGQELMKRGVVDLSPLDAKVEELCTKLLYTFPDCTTKTIEELRKPKLDAWNRNKENSRAWLALNMMTEARAGFRAFNEGTKDTGREVDFIALRRALAANERWDDELTESIMPGAAQRRDSLASRPRGDGAASRDATRVGS
ncbi:MAG TPA: 6-oxocyclohex-1-ene-1-carbonyl-CoA hydratase [Xanthobacteraceae bacterium]|nr:6-oxocyclohex-1-ene-1-carbonyl-CoA hydratase [Xanthobacteraceae bacterium]